MVTSTDNWLDCLVKHSIFEINEFERKHVNVRNTSNSVTDFILQHHTCVLTMRDNDLLVAVGSKIRVLNLTEFKEKYTEVTNNNLNSSHWLSSIPYKLLDTPEIDFTIQSLTPNSNGRLLSVKGKQSLVVVCLPRQGFADVSMLKRDIGCRTLAIGRKYYNKAQLLKVVWHPLSETRTHLVVLDSDSMLRIYDVSVDIEEPEQTFDLLSIKGNKNKSDSNRRNFFEGSNEYKDAATFSLGGASHDQSDWEPFTIYYALRNGDIYSICPVIPFKSAINKKHLNHLIRYTEAKYQKDTYLNKDLSCLQHSKQWLQELFDSAKIGTNSTNDDVISVAHSSTLPVRSQGPFLINCQPKAPTGSQVTDMLYVSSEPMRVLVLAFSHGQIRNYILSTESSAQWQLSDTGKEFNAMLVLPRELVPTAILYESVDIKTKSAPSNQLISLVSDPLYRETYYAYHTCGVTCVDMAGWLDRFKEMLKSKDVTQGLNEKTTSVVRYLINTAPLYGTFTPVAGVCVMTNAYLSYRMIAITFDYQLAYVNFNTHREDVEKKEDQEAIKSQLKCLAEEKEAYESLLPLPLFKRPQKSERVPTYTKIVVPSELEDSNELLINTDTLDLVSKSAEKISSEVRKLTKAAVKSKERLGLQQKEFENQVKSLSELYNTYLKYFSSEAKKAQKDALQEIAQKHAQLKSRVDKQLRFIMSHCQESVSDEENEWIERLKELSDKLTGSSGYASRIEKLQAQLKQVEEQSRKDKKFNPTNMSMSQLQTFLSTLKGQSDPINEMKQRIDHMKREVSTR